MKKSLKLILSAFAFSSAFLFVACTPPNYYSIDAYPSDSNIGSVAESTLINSNPQAEGTKITLNARENFPDTNPFLCWVKDHEDIVSTASSIDLTYNAKSQGRYTAVFKETNLNGMMYSVLSNIKYTNSGAYFTSIKYTVEYARTSTGSDVFSEFNSGELFVNNAYSPKKDKVLYFGEPGNNYYYKIRVNLSLTSGNTTTSISFEFSDLLEQDNFGTKENYTITKDYTGYGNLTLIFSKVNTDTFNAQ